MARLTGFPETAAHEIAINIDNSENLVLVQDEVKNIASGEEVMNWKRTVALLSYLTEIMDLYMYISIYFVSASFWYYQHHVDGGDGTHKRTGYADGNRHEQKAHF